MKKAIFIATMLVSTMLMSACNESKKITTADLINHRFVLIKFNNEDVSPDKQAEIEFTEDMNVTGKMCNRFVGKTILENDTLKSNGLAMTKMLCNDEQLNKLDNIIGQLFADGAK